MTYKTETADVGELMKRRMAQITNVGWDRIGDLTVCTKRDVGIHQPERGLYETSLGDDEHRELYLVRYETREEAENGHARIVSRMRMGWRPAKENNDEE